MRINPLNKDFMPAKNMGEHTLSIALLKVKQLAKRACINIRDNIVAPVIFYILSEHYIL